MEKLKIRPFVPMQFRRAALKDSLASIEAARDIFDDMADALGISDFRDIDMLDVGCGVRYTQAIITYDLPVKSYTGVDTYGEMIDYLRENVDDPRFTFLQYEANNELYATDQQVMTETSYLPVGDDTFDVICAQSLFTHFSPDEFQTMLKLMRRVIRPDGHLLFSTFLNEPSASGHGYVDHWLKRLTPEQRKIAEAAQAENQEKFIDAVPGEPLLVALFRRDYAIEMVQSAGWEILDIRDPKPFIHHQFVCRPA
jgi:SAM-dependent methyltransferase